MVAKVAIVGDGLLGTTIKDVLPEATLWAHRDIDILSESSVRHALFAKNPDVVINTAAFHRLGECETARHKAFDVNAKGAELLAKLVPTVYISTDYVFNDGGPHDECLPGQQPRSIYGRSKLAGEMATLAAGGVVVRVAGLYGHYKSHKGPTFPEAVLSDHAPMALPTDQIFSPTYAPDAAGRILDIALALADGEADGIYHATNRGATNWAEFAEHILIYAHHERHILPFVANDDLRPRNSALVSKRLPPLPHWADALSRWASG